MADALTSLGICLGASTVSIAQLTQKPLHSKVGAPSRQSSTELIDFAYYPHEGDPKRTLRKAVERLDLSSFDRIVATGRKFRKFVNLTSISEPEAVEYAYQHIKPADVSCPAVISAGGETFMVYALDRAGRISNVITGNKCASGTGEFFLQMPGQRKVGI